MWLSDENTHWQECSVCHDILNQSDHIYDDGGDTTCNVCGYDRTESIRHTITFLPNGGNGSMEVQQVIGAQVITLPECGFTPPARMQFKAWLGIYTGLFAHSKRRYRDCCRVGADS